MTDKEILEKAISKAIDGGWVNIECFKPVDLYAGDVGLEYADTSAVVIPSAMIFNHDFAKALWGEAVYGTLAELKGDATPNKLPHWQYHLQQMVIAHDPIKYLGDNI